MVTDKTLVVVFWDVMKHYRLPLSDIHGAGHWGRVLENGMRLAERTGANKEVVRLFALLHDSRRVNEDLDREHGRRGAELARSLQGRIYTLPPGDLELLCQACELHASGNVDDDITVQTCWDADRLDLRRVGIVPRPEYLCTAAAKDPAMIEWAGRRSLSGHMTAFARELMHLATVNELS